jgi:hypothetical protein
VSSHVPGFRPRHGLLHWAMLAWAHHSHVGPGVDWAKKGPRVGLTGSCFMYNYTRLLDALLSRLPNPRCGVSPPHTPHAGPACPHRGERKSLKGHQLASMTWLRWYTTTTRCSSRRYPRTSCVAIGVGYTQRWWASSHPRRGANAEAWPGKRKVVRIGRFERRRKYVQLRGWFTQATQLKTRELLLIGALFFISPL